MFYCRVSILILNMSWHLHLFFLNSFLESAKYKIYKKWKLNSFDREAIRSRETNVTD